MASFDSRPDPYRVLAVDRNAGSEEIKKRFTKLIWRHHPGRFAPEPWQADILSEIQSAYELLADHNARAMYDDFVRLKARRQGVLFRLESEHSVSPERVPREIMREDFDQFGSGPLENGREEPDDTNQQQRLKNRVTAPMSKVASWRMSQPIEDEIAERNLAFERLKAAGRSRSPHPSSRSETAKPTKRQTLYTVPVDQLNLQVMNPQVKKALVDIAAVHG